MLEAKGDEGYFIGYSMSSKAFRVFNKRTNRVEVNLHVDFLKNKAIEKGACPNWLFDIDSLTNFLNYVPVVGAGTHSTNFQVQRMQQVKRYIALPNWVHDALLESPSSNAQDTCKADAPKSIGNPNPTASTTNPPADQIYTLTVETSIPTISSPVPTACFTDSQEPSTSPTPTLRIHKDHPKSQVIGLMDTPIQTGISPKRATIDQTLFIRRQRGDFILVQVYVDDIIFGSSNPQLCREFKALMHEKFRMSAMGDVLKKFGYLDVRSSNTPMDKENPWGKEGTGKDVDLHLYRSMIGSLMYLTASRPDIMLSMPCEALSKEISSSILLLIETTEEGTKILATVDGKLRIVSESSIRRNLKLNNEVGISSLLDAELFENLQLMGYNILPNQKFTFQKGQFSHQWKYLIHTIMQCLSPKSTGFNEFSSNIATALGEGSGTPTESHHIPTPEASQSSQHELPSPSLPPVPTESLPTIIPTDTPPLRYYTKRARIAQSLALSPVADELASLIGDANLGEACPTDSGLEADQDRANIPKTSTLPSDSTPRSDMVSKFEALEFEINSLKARIKLLKDKHKGVAEQSGDDAPIKGRRLDKGEEVAERVSDDIEEMATILTSMDTASILTNGGVQVVSTAPEVSIATVSIPTSSGVVSTTSPTIPTTAIIFTTATDSTPYTRSKGKETMVESETPKKKKEKPERFKRKGLILEQESVKKLKTSEEETLSIRPATSNKKKELWVELKRLFEPDVEDYLWTHTQNLMHAPVEWRLYDTCGVHHVSTKDQDIFMLIEKDYPLMKGLPIVMISYKLQVENYSQMANDLIIKIYNIANSPRQQARVKFLEDRQGEDINLSGDNTPFKGRRLDEGEVATKRVSCDTEEIRRDEGEVASKRVSDDKEEMATVLIIMDATSLLLSGGVQVVPTATTVVPANVSISTGTGVVPTVSTTISTATPIFATATTVTPYTRRKGK
nr:hypothetical protein [Tanacetum cinerariifolium]